MTTGWPVLCLLFLLPQCCSTSSRQRGVHKFSQSLYTTRRILEAVNRLRKSYEEQQFGGHWNEDRHKVLTNLPSQWKSIQDGAHLNTVSKDLHTFWAHLDIRRQQMENFWNNRTDNIKAMDLIKNMAGIQRRLQNLIGQVNSQLGSLNSTSLPSSSPAPQMLIHPTDMPLKQDLWSNRRQGYIVLRDLERYLGKLARFFILLKTRHSGGPVAPTNMHAT